MADRRELSRREARRRRAVAKKEALEATNANCELADSALTKAALIIADAGFARLLVQLGVDSLPACLNKRTLGPLDENPAGERLNRISLEFAVAWRFFYPLFNNANANAYFETNWPGFVAQMKDAFIALVVDGPFPHAMSGHRGRRHHSDYHLADRNC